jgi:hypothetical protein
MTDHVPAVVPRHRHQPGAILCSCGWTASFTTTRGAERLWQGHVQRPYEGLRLR